MSSPTLRSIGTPHRETRKRTARNRKTGELEERTSIVWAVTLEFDPHPDGSRNRRTIRRKNRNEVIAAANRFRDELARGQRQLRQARTTVGDWLEYWLPEIAKPRMRPNPYKSYVSMCRRNIIPHIGKHQLSKLEPAHVRYMLTKIIECGLSVRSAEVAYNTLHKALDDALREPSLGLMTNVVERVDKPRPAARTLDAPIATKALPAAGERDAEKSRGYVQRSRQPLDTTQARAVIRHALDTGDRLAVRWALALLTGARQGECLGLDLDRVDLDRGTLDLSWALQRVPLKRDIGDALPVDDVYPVDAFDIRPGFEIRPLYRGLALVRPKTNSSVRLMPIPDPLMVLLRAHIEAMQPNRHGLLFVRLDGRPYSPDIDRAEWTRATAAVGAPDVVPHAARHTTSTLLLEAGVPEDVRMAIMGHSSAAAQRIYAHTDVELKRSSLSALDGILAPDDEDEQHALAS